MRYYPATFLVERFLWNKWKQKIDFQDEDINKVWSENTDVSARREAIIKHEKKHIEDAHNAYNAVKEKLQKAERDYPSKKECSDKGDELLDEVQKDYQKAGDESPRQRG